MTERFFFNFFFSDKSITNPINKSENFLCSDIFSDYLRCRAMNNKGLKPRSLCRELRSLGTKCYISSEDEFEKHLLKVFEEKKKYINFLEKEGSLLFYHYTADPTVFSIRKFDEEATELTPELNEFISKYK